MDSQSASDVPSADGPEAQAYVEQATALRDEAIQRTRCLPDLAYGSHPQQRLDLYLPRDGSARGLPVLVCFHGGRWSMGYKELLSFMAPAVLDFPALFVSADHRLAPEARFPAQPEDCAAAVAWTYRHIAEYGGDASRIFVAGHSSGGHLASLIAVRPNFLAGLGMPSDAIKGCFPISATFDLVFPSAPPGSEEALILDTLLERREDARLASPLRHVAGLRTPFYIVYGSRDLGRVVRSGSAMVRALMGEPCRLACDVFAEFHHFQTSLETRHADGIWMRTVRAWMGAAR
jgi:arylformamidase